MKLQPIKSAELVGYNANTSGHYTSDCVKRALSLAFDIPYNEVSKELNSILKSSRYDRWNIYPVYGRFISDHGGSAQMNVPNKMTLEEFTDTIGKEGTYLVRTGSNPERSNHIVCVIDGKVYDSWDSLDQYAIKYNVVKKGKDTSRTFTSININDFRDEILETARQTYLKLVSKYNWNHYVDSVDISTYTSKINQYQMLVSITLQFDSRPYNPHYTLANADYSIVFTPSTTEEEAHKIIKQTTQTRIYDRLYAINQTEKKKQETYEKYGDVIEMPHYLNGTEKRFWKTLPGKIQRIVKDIRIQDPGQYMGSYTVYVKAIWGETDSWIRNSERVIDLEAYDADEMRELLEEYVTTGKTYIGY